MRLNDVIKIFNVAIYTSQIKHAGYGTLARRCLLQRGEVETMQMFPMLALLQCRPGPDTIQRCNVDIHTLCGQLGRKFIFTILLSSDIRQ